jgi:hypothetical protein
LEKLAAAGISSSWLSKRTPLDEVRRHVITAQRGESVAIGFEESADEQGYALVHLVPRQPGVELPAGIERVTE